MGTGCSTDAAGIDAASESKGAEEARRVVEAAIVERTSIHRQASESEPMWKTDTGRLTQKRTEAAAAAAAAAVTAAQETAAAAAAEAEAAAAADAGAGVWAEGEAGKGKEDAKEDSGKKKKEEEAAAKKKKADAAAAKKKKEQEAKKKAEEEAAKKAKEAEEAVKKDVPQEDAGAKEAIREREQAWKKKSTKEKTDLGAKIREAAKNGDIPGVQGLLDQGVSPNAEDGDGWTPIIVAADKGEATTCELLLKSGANAKAAIKLGEWGQTALHFAARHGRRNICEILVPASNCKAKNFLGKTASEMAKAEGHKDLAKWLRGQEK